MIGISFAYPDAADQFRRPPWTELRCARIEPGPDDDRYYWRMWDIPDGVQLMDEIAPDLEGFTLFWSPQKKMWQKSVRRKDEAGWVVEHITNDQAQATFRVLEGHSVGPWQIDEVQNDQEAAADVDSRKGSSAAARYEASVEDALDTGCADDLLPGSADDWRKHLPDDGLEEAVEDLTAALEAAERAVRRSSDLLATLTL